MLFSHVRARVSAPCSPTSTLALPHTHTRSPSSQMPQCVAAGAGGLRTAPRREHHTSEKVALHGGAARAAHDRVVGATGWRKGASGAANSEKLRARQRQRQEPVLDEAQHHWAQRFARAPDPAQYWWLERPLRSVCERRVGMCVLFAIVFLDTAGSFPQGLSFSPRCAPAGRLGGGMLPPYMTNIPQVYLTST